MRKLHSMEKMYKLSAVVFFNFLILVLCGDKDEPKILPSHARMEEAQILRKIEPGEALPVVLFFDKSTSELRIPRFLNEIHTLKERIVEGTTFDSGSKTANKQMFFCPNKNSKDECLVHEKFKKSEPLECAKEPVPVIDNFERIHQTKCGPGNQNPDGTLHGFVYKICENQEINGWLQFSKYVGFSIELETVRGNDLEIYSFCYNTAQKKTIFTVHEIKLPLLMNVRVLFREQEIEYDMMNDQVVSSTQPESENTPAEEEFNSPIVKEKPGYRLQKLVPSDDMALALWRKPTFQYLNTELQHESLFDLWNEIHKDVRSEAIYKFGSKNIRTQFVTGVLDIPIEDLPESKDNDQIFNVWVKVIFEKASDGGVSGVAIFMNNFVSVKENPYMSENSSEGKFIEKYCRQNYCSTVLKTNIQKVGGYICCCQVTKEIQKLFGMKDDHFASPVPLLFLPHVTNTYV